MKKNCFNGVLSVRIHNLGIVNSQLQMKIRISVSNCLQKLNHLQIRLACFVNNRTNKAVHLGVIYDYLF